MHRRQPGRAQAAIDVQPAADGQLYLTGVRLAAWEGIELPRQWDDPDREENEDPYEQLVDFAERVWEAMGEWNLSLVHLLPPSPFDLPGNDRE